MMDDRQSHAYNNYHNLICEVVDAFKHLSLGGEQQRKEYEERIANFPIDSVRDKVDGRFKCLQNLLRRMILIHGTTLLESMVKEYVRISGSAAPVTPDSNTHVDLNGRYQNLPDETRLPDEEWGKLLDKWTRQAVKEGVDSGMDSDALERGARTVKDVASKHQRGRLLLFAWLVRNLEVHCKGVMDAKGHKRAPICDIGTRPEWGLGLLYDLFLSLGSLNSALSQGCQP